MGSSARGEETLGVFLLLLERLREGGEARNDAQDHDDERNDGPDHAPTLGRAAVALREHAGVGAVDLAQDEIIAL